MTDEIKVGALRRELPTRDVEVDGKRLKFSASSEAPVERYFGIEVLSHDDGAIRSDRLARGAVPLLFNHDWDKPIGMVDAAAIRNRRLEVDAHLFDTDLAREVGKMIDGGLRNVSIGYQINEAETEGDGLYRATDWTLLEASIVTVPADPSIGIGRTADDGARQVRVRTVSQPAAPAATKESSMDQQNPPAGQTADIQVRDNGPAPAPAKTAAQMEADRKQAIVNLCRANKLDERFEQHWISTGTSLNDVANEMVGIMQERAKHTPASPAFLDMSAKEVRSYSLMRAIRASMSGDWTKAGLEGEAHKAVMERTAKQPRAQTSFFVPMDVQRRDITAAGVNGSNYLVSTDNQPGSFIELLRNRSCVFALGATRLPGLVGNVTIPKQSAASTAYWLADESTQITESNPTFVQVTLTAKNVAALTEISHQLISQSSPAAEQLVMSDLAAVIARAVDVAAIRGSGASGQPQGIVGSSGVGSVSGSSLGVAGIVEFQSDVAAGNALVAGSSYLTTPAVAGLLMQRQRFSSTDTPLWEGGMLDGRVMGFRAMSSNQMSSATMLFGDFSQVIIGEWGVLELMTNPYSDFTRGLTGLRAWYTCDVAVRQTSAFSYASSIT